MIDDIIEAGTLLIIERGEYSDSSWHGPVRVLKSFSKSAVAGEFERREQTEEQREWCDAPAEFLPWLIVAGYVEDDDLCVSWHVGSYGRFEP